MDLHSASAHDNVRGHDLDMIDDVDEGGLEAAAAARPEEPVLTAAVLVATAFRLRDERGLIKALRLLVGAVSTWESVREVGAAS